MHINVFKDGWPWHRGLDPPLSAVPVSCFCVVCISYFNFSAFF